MCKRLLKFKVDELKEELRLSSERCDERTTVLEMKLFNAIGEKELLRDKYVIHLNYPFPY